MSRRCLRAVMFTLLACTLAANASAGETLQRVLARKTLVAVVDPSYPPFSFLNDKNVIDGFDIDVARAVAKKLGVTLRTETPSWEIIAAGHWRGRWDVCICSMTPDQQKARVLDFVAPYYASPAVIVTTAENHQINAPGDMTGKKIGVEQGSSYERYLQHDLDLGVVGANKLVYLFKQVRTVPYASEDMAFQDLALGAGKRIDAIVSNQITAKYRLARLPGKFRIVGEPLYQEPNWVTIDKGDAEWRLKIGAIIAGLKEDGTLTQISKKWLGVDVTR